ncbi:MAG: asparagine synthase (glutamine-hydrolyzing) [Ginsengibacter sp.]
MCGISGYISLNNSISPLLLAKATDLLQHRGPDAGGFYFSDDNKVGLGHRRLSILDLSTSANQPMFSSNGRYVIVYNGEVYNFNELKQKLRDKGVSLKTTSDTEVILQLFAEQGVNCFKDFNGMFSLVIYDLVKKVLTMCRDHAGIKPLFIYYDETDFVFASELKSIQLIKSAQLTINKSAIPYFLHLGYIPHPLTIFNNVEKFPAAHYLQIDINSNNFHSIPSGTISFWNPESTIEVESLKDEKAAKRILTGLLADSVEKQLVSDVPIGTFLSGGIDSSLVTALACQASAQKVNTFSLAIDDGKFDESNYATQVAQNLQTHHYEFRVKEKEVVDLLDNLLAVYDEPFADSSALPTMMVSRLAKKHVTVALTGDGGDELFMGYGMYGWAKRLSQKWVPYSRHSLFAASKIMNDRYRRAGNLFGYDKKENIKSHIFSQEQYFFTEQELANILTGQKFDFGKLNATSPSKRHLNEQEQQSIWDFNYYLKDDLLVKVDRASMHYSLETRVPLLDYRIIEFAFNLDSELKIKGKTMKYLLKQVLYDYLPKEIFDRPKWGFAIPLKKWLKTDLNYLLVKYTSREVIERHNVLQYSQVEKIKKQYLAGRDHLFNRLWVILVLHWWLEENNVYS